EHDRRSRTQGHAGARRPAALARAGPRHPARGRDRPAPASAREHAAAARGRTGADLPGRAEMMSAILTIAEATKRIEAKQLSPVELAKMQLERIRRLDPQLNAFLLVTEDRALADAKAAEARQ